MDVALITEPSDTIVIRETNRTCESDLFRVLVE